MKWLVTIFFTLFLLVFIPSSSQAVCDSFLYTFDTTSISDLKSEIESRFPFSFLVVASDLLLTLSSIPQTSPSEITLDLPLVTFQPLSWMSVGGFDLFMAGVRVLMLVVVIFSVVKHLLEYVL